MIRYNCTKRGIRSINTRLLSLSVWRNHGCDGTWNKFIIRIVEQTPLEIFSYPEIDILLTESNRNRIFKRQRECGSAFMQTAIHHIEVDKDTALSFEKISQQIENGDLHPMPMNPHIYKS